jgi:hypothetical protein
MSDYTDGLRNLADFLDLHPNIVPHAKFDCCFFFSGDEAKSELASFTRAIGGMLQKEKVGGFMEVAKCFGPHKITGNVSEDLICERKVVGTETVEIPDPEAPKITVEREIVEWVCPPVLS